MTRKWRTPLTDWAAALALFTAPAVAADQPQVAHSFDLRVPQPPRIAKLGGVETLAYELHLNSFTQRAIIVDRVELVDDSSRSILTTLPGAELATTTGEPLAELATLPPGTRAIAYLNVPLPSGKRPDKIGHRVLYRFVDDEASIRRSVEGSLIALDSKALPRLGSPLRGGPWIAVYDPKMAFGHRRMVLATNGAARIPGRFAIDFFGVDPNGRNALDETGRLDRYVGYGAEVLAVADATVVAARDDMTEPTTTKARQKFALGDETGNYVTLDLGNGHFVFYEHLQPGLLIKKGDRVRRGQVIGRLGLTGSGSRPHLHFHVADGNSPLGAEGLPYCFASVEGIGSYPSISSAFEGKPWRPGATPIDQCLPAPNTVVRFASLPQSR